MPSVVPLLAMDCDRAARTTDEIAVYAWDLVSDLVLVVGSETEPCCKGWERRRGLGNVIVGFLG